jgi:eukaryotic-like serine/threonine-protein kinase
MGPVRDLQWRLSYGALIATLFLLLLVTALIIGMMSVFDGAPRSRVTRFLRRWAGLPTGTTGPSTATATSSTGSLGARTAREEATPNQESGDRRQESGNQPPT